MNSGVGGGGGGGQGHGTCYLGEVLSTPATCSVQTGIPIS